ncbi:unnamed protein product [Cylindrotheca closterium]|uniref:Uncharacterized protein n=1 Tax=Cylindrotheca closterium TaxID=2856 RepID=A0AAD2JIZ6_9STRA|nr:unnamed protein product [Cylindrotheca closterium]
MTPKRIEIIILLSKSEMDSEWPQRLQILVNDALGGTKIRVTVRATSILDHDERAMEEFAAIVVDCRGADEMEFLNTKFNSDIIVQPDAMYFLHVWKQERIRSLLLTTIPSPLYILVGGSPRNNNPLSSSVYSRTVQRLAHWYQLGYIMKGQDENEDSFEQTIAFAILVWIEDFCSSTTLDDAKALLPGVQQLTSEVMPPSLELSTTWQGISEEWHRMERQ